MLENLFLAVASGLVSAAIAILHQEPHRLPSWLFLHSKSHLRGAWVCGWQCDPANPAVWSFDDVGMVRRLGKLRIHVTFSPRGFSWETSLVANGDYLTGQWGSMKPDSTACGTLTLRLSKQGDALVGYHVGPTENRMMCGRVIMAKDKYRVHEVKEKFDDYL